jgi:hypothetical protein
MVTGLNIMALCVKQQAATPLRLLAVVAAISNMTQLQSLVLANIGLTGPLQDASRPGLDTFTQLRHLDLSHNPGITGELPKAWFTLSALETLDISHTGILSNLPSAYATLQNLREFRAVNCTGIN